MATQWPFLVFAPLPVGEGRGEGIRPQRRTTYPLRIKYRYGSASVCCATSSCSIKVQNPGISRVVAGSSAIISSVSPAACYARSCVPSLPAPGSEGPEHQGYGLGWKTGRSWSSRSGKNGCSLRPVADNANQVNDCAKINHCNVQPKQYHAAVFIGFPHPNV